MEINIDTWGCWDYYIWGCWYFVLSVIAAVLPVYASFMYVLFMRPTFCCPTDVSLPPFFPYVDRLIDR